MRGRRYLNKWSAVAVSVGSMALLGLSASAAHATAISVVTTGYSQTITVPVPPASNYAGSAGGDGWAVALSNTQAFNVFHHDSILEVVAHNQSNASTAWGPSRIYDPTSGHNFASSGQPGMYLDQRTGKLYVYATDTSTSTGGVVCVDTTQGATNPDPFCGFTPLTAAGQASLTDGFGLLTNPVLIGHHLYAFNYVPGAGVVGTENKLVCFDVNNDAACASQPYTVSVPSGSMDNLGFSPAPGDAAVGTKDIIPVRLGGNSFLGCFDDSTMASCTGDWPAAAPSGYVGNYGDPFPMLDSSGHPIGACLPAYDTCTNLNGDAVSAPPGLAGIGSGSVNWNGPGFTVGPRVYVPAWGNTVYCYDFAAQAECANFPLQFQNLDLLYTVNPDPQRPACLWVNSDYGSQQIQDFDAYTGGPCGQGSARVLVSQFVVPTVQCAPTSYQSLDVLAPDPSTYSGGTVTVEDLSGTPVDSNLPIVNGVADLSSLNPASVNGLPQFLVTLPGASSATSMHLKLNWVDTSDPTDQSCVQPVPATFASPGTASGLVGQPFSFIIRSAGTPTAVITVNGMPTWMTLTRNGDGTATISGVPPQAGVYNLSVVADNTAGSALQSLAVTIDQAPSIVSSSSATAVLGTPFSFTVHTTGFPAPAIAAGTPAPPSWLTVADNGNGTATLSGTPTGSTGPVSFQITATNSVSQAVQTFTANLNPALTAPVIGSLAACATATAGQPYTCNLTSTGNPTPTFTVNAMPAWMHFTRTSGGGTISGTPPRAGAWTVQVVAQSGQSKVTQPLTVTVS